MTVLRDQACKCVSLSRDYIQRRCRRRRPRRPSQMISKSIDTSRQYIYKSRATRVFATGLSTSKSHQIHQPTPSTPLFFDPYHSRAFQATTPHFNNRNPHTKCTSSPSSALSSSSASPPTLLPRRTPMRPLAVSATQPPNPMPTPMRCAGAPLEHIR